MVEPPVQLRSRTARASSIRFCRSLALPRPRDPAVPAFGPYLPIDSPIACPKHPVYRGEPVRATASAPGRLDHVSYEIQMSPVNTTQAGHTQAGLTDAGPAGPAHAGPRTAAGRAGLDAVRAAPGRALVALDYDGTLAPIVADPARAWPADGAVDTLRRLAGVVGTLAVVTGRPAGQV